MQDVNSMFECLKLMKLRDKENVILQVSGGKMYKGCEPQGETEVSEWKTTPPCIYTKICLLLFLFLTPLWLQIMMSWICCFSTFLLSSNSPPNPAERTSCFTLCGAPYNQMLWLASMEDQPWKISQIASFYLPLHNREGGEMWGGWGGGASCDGARLFYCKMFSPNSALSSL